VTPAAAQWPAPVHVAGSPVGVDRPCWFHRADFTVV